MKVVVRQSGERTKDLCLESLLKNLVGKISLKLDIIRGDSVHDVSLKTIESFKSSKEDNLLVVDADVVLFDVEPILSNLERDFVNFIPIDKFRRAKLLPCGVKLYSRKFFKVFGELMLDYMGTCREKEFIIRPEGFSIKEACKKIDVPYYEDSRPLGVHDYSQNHEDLFRKYVWRAWRQPDSMPSWKSHWKFKNKMDLDYKVIEESLSWAEKKEPFIITRSTYIDYFRSLGFSPKSPRITKSEINLMSNDFIKYSKKTVINYNRIVFLIEGISTIENLESIVKNIFFKKFTNVLPVLLKENYSEEEQYILESFNGFCSSLKDLDRFLDDSDILILNNKTEIDVNLILESFKDFNVCALSNKGDNLKELKGIKNLKKEVQAVTFLEFKNFFRKPEQTISYNRRKIRNAI